MTKTIELNKNELREVRKALSLTIKEMNCIEEEDRFYLIDNLYDRIANLEEELEESECED